MFLLIHLKHLPTNGLFNPDMLNLSKRRVKLNTARFIFRTDILVKKPLKFTEVCKEGGLG